VSVVEEQLEDGGHHDGQADHDGVAVVLPTPGGQVDPVVVAVHVSLVGGCGPGTAARSMRPRGRLF